MRLEPDKVSTMVSTMGCEQFGTSVLDLFDDALELTHCAAFERRDPTAAPRIVAAASRTPAGQAACLDLAEQWTSNDYKTDPLLADIEKQAVDSPSVHYADVPSAPRTAGMRSRMIEQYYDRLDIGEEATFTYRDGRYVLGISLFKRRGSSRFDSFQRDSLDLLTGLMLKSTYRHARLLVDPALPGEPRPGQEKLVSEPVAHTRAEQLARLRSALLMNKSGLTVREAEICASIVLGYSGLAIGLMLGISVNTVATHRKRAYSKLGIKSQTELFDICLRYCV